MTFATFIVRTEERPKMSSLLNDLELPHFEYGGTRETSFVVSANSPQEKIRVEIVRHSIMSRVHAENAVAKMMVQSMRAERNRKALSRINLWRVVTFRKPLAKLPLHLLEQ